MIPAGEAHVWLASVTALSPRIDELRGLLRPAELQRRDPEHVIGRAVLRVLLGRYLGLRADAIEIERRCEVCGGPHGRPVVRGLSASIAYSADVIAFAFALARVGIDVERIRRDLDWRPVARVALPAAHVQAIASQPAERSLPAFFAEWTTREALGKAVGVGLGVPPDELDRRARALAPSWTLAAVSAPSGYRAAVAVAQPAVRVRQLGWADPRRLRDRIVPCAGVTSND